MYICIKQFKVFIFIYFLVWLIPQVLAIPQVFAAHFMCCKINSTDNFLPSTYILKHTNIHTFTHALKSDACSQ